MQIFKLTQYEYVRVSGPDALAFLQGQVTCDMAMLSADRSLPGALCNLKGRVVADFLAVLVDNECFLQITAGNAEKVYATLKKYAVFFKRGAQPGRWARGSAWHNRFRYGAIPTAADCTMQFATMATTTRFCDDS